MTVLDGLTVSAGTVLLADGVQRLLAAGSSVEEVTAWVDEARGRMQILIAVDTTSNSSRVWRKTASDRSLKVWLELPDFVNSGMFTSDKVIAGKRDVLVRTLVATGQPIGT